MDLVVSVFVLTVLCVCLRVFGRHTVRYVYLSNKIKGPSLMCIATRHVREVLSDKLLDFVNKTCEKYNFEPWGAWFYWNFAVVVSDPDTVREVYRHVPNKTNLLYEIIGKYIGDGMLNLNGEVTKRHRKIVIPSFRKNAIESNLPQINKAAGRLMQQMQAVVEKSANLEKIVEGEVIHLAFWLLTSGVYTLNKDVIAAFRVLQEIMDIVQMRSANPVYYWLIHHWKKSKKKADVDLVTLFRDFKEVIEEAKRRFATKVRECDVYEPSSGFECMLYAYLGMGEEVLSEDEIVTLCVTIFSESVETTTFMIHASIMLMALHPDVQQRVFEEQEAIFGQSQRELEKEDLPKMVYLEKVLKETLRLFPPAPVIGRITDQEIKINGLNLPKRCTIIINKMALQRNSNHYKDPNKFDPDRFAPENSQGRHPFSFVPFSYGSRNCPGQVQANIVAKTLLSYFVRTFRVFPGEGFEKIEDIKVKMRLTIGLRRPVALRITAR